MVCSYVTSRHMTHNLFENTNNRTPSSTAYYHGGISTLKMYLNIIYPRTIFALKIWSKTLNWTNFIPTKRLGRWGSPMIKIKKSVLKNKLDVILTKTDIRQRDMRCRVHWKSPSIFSEEKAKRYSTKFQIHNSFCSIFYSTFHILQGFFSFGKKLTSKVR